MEKIDKFRSQIAAINAQQEFINSAFSHPAFGIKRHLEDLQRIVDAPATRAAFQAFEAHTPDADFDAQADLISFGGDRSLVLDQIDKFDQIITSTTAIASDLQSLLIAANQRAEDNAKRAEFAEKTNRKAVVIARWALAVAILSGVASSVSALIAVLQFLKTP